MISTMTTTPDRIHIGKVLGPHGVKGDLKLKFFSEHIPALLEIEGRGYRLLKKHLHQENIWIVSLEGVNDRNQAETLASKAIWIERSALPQLSADEFYLVDLLGYSVRDIQETRSGVVFDIVIYPASDCLKVRSGEEIWEVPMHERYVTKVNHQEKTIEVSHWDELEPVDG